MTTIKTIAFTIYTDENAETRIRCCFCGDQLYNHHGELDEQEALILLRMLRDHGCFQPGNENSLRRVRHGLTN